MEIIPVLPLSKVIAKDFLSLKLILQRKFTIFL